MVPVSRFAIAALFALALVAVLAPARGEDSPAAEPARPAAGEASHACLDQKDRRAESGRLVSLATAMRAARGRMPGTVVRARLCHAPDGLVYVLTVLARDGKVARITVDAVKGTLVGGL
jgi:uncharacterized membrane protein YkoI